MTPNPHAIKMELERRLIERRASITDLHSCLIEDGRCHVAYDIVDVTGDASVLDIEFPQLPGLAGHDDLTAFTRWLAAEDDRVTVH